MPKQKSSVKQKPYNPFLDDYVQEEIKFYGLSEYDKDGIKIQPVKVQGRCDDLFNVNFRMNDFDCPQFFIDGNLWMSLTQMEIQSQYLPIKKANGKVALGGLGMGYCLLRVMEKDDVKSIDVYEMESRVVDFFKENFSRRKGFEKVNFIVGDARKEMHSKVYDFVYMDIYQSMLPNEVLEDKTLFCDNNNIEEYYFWAQEKIFKIGYEYGYIQLEDMPKNVLELFKLWTESDGARMKDRELDDEFIIDGLNSFGIEV